MIPRREKRRHRHRERSHSKLLWRERQWRAKDADYSLLDELPPSVKVWVLAPLVILGCLGLTVATFGQDAWQAWRTASWKALPANVVSRSAEKRVVEWNPLSRSDQRRRWDNSYWLRVTYRYRYNGADYEAEWSDTRAHGSGEVPELMAAYRPGVQLSCYVNPDRPTEAVLERGFEWSSLAGLWPTVIAAACALAYWQHSRQRRGRLTGGMRGGMAGEKDKARADVY